MQVDITEQEGKDLAPSAIGLSKMAFLAQPILTWGIVVTTVHEVSEYANENPTDKSKQGFQPVLRMAGMQVLTARRLPRGLPPDSPHHTIPHRPNLPSYTVPHCRPAAIAAISTPCRRCTTPT